MERLRRVLPALRTYQRHLADPSPVRYASRMSTHTNTDTHTVANRLYELCSAGKYQEAMQELYADDATQIEAMEMPGSPYGRVVSGKDVLLEMGEEWMKDAEIHDAHCGKPLINGDQFVCEMSLDVTHASGPMAGQRMKMSEICLYTVRDGKIAEAKFFYSV